MLNIGYDNFVAKNKILAIVSPDSAPLKRDVSEHKDKGACIDATYGSRTKAIIYLSNGYIVLSSLSPATLNNKLSKSKNTTQEEGI